MPNATTTFAADIAQAMRDWNAATDAQRAHALRIAAELAAAADRRLIAAAAK